MPPLILLHGALGAAAQFSPLVKALGNSFTTHAFSFPGHGGEPLPAGPFTMEDFVQAVLQKMDELGVERANFFGYSMGGYVAMLLAKTAPQRVGKVATLATKYHWDPAVAAGEARMLDPEKVREKVPHFARTLEDRHAPADWTELMRRTADLLKRLGDGAPLFFQQYAAIRQPCLLLLGDRDKMVTLDETLAVYHALPDAQLSVLPATPHPIEEVPLQLLSTELRVFFDE